MAELKNPELIKFSDFFTSYHTLTRFIILNPLQQYVNPTTGARKHLAIWSFWIINASLFAFFGMEFIYLVKLIRDVENATVIAIISSAAWLVLGLIALECMLFIWLKRERLTRLLGLIEASFPQTQELQEYGKLSQDYADWNTISTVTLRIYLFAINMIYLQPLAMSIFGFISTGTWFLKLPGLLWYPFDYEDDRNRVFAYIWECWGYLIVTRSVLSVGIFLGSATMLMSSQFKTLAREYREQKPRKGNAVSDYKKLAELIRKHNYLIGVASELEDIFRVSLVVNYVISSVVIGFFGFLVLNEVEIIKKMEYFFDFCAFMCYNSLFAFYGNSLIDSSEDIGTALYESDWFDADLRYKKNMVLVMARCCKPSQLDGFFFVVSYKSYTKILASSYSYLALLRVSSQKQI